MHFFTNWLDHCQIPIHTCWCAFSYDLYQEFYFSVSFVLLFIYSEKSWNAARDGVCTTNFSYKWLVDEKTWLVIFCKHIVQIILFFSEARYEWPRKRSRYSFGGKFWSSRFIEIFVLWCKQEVVKLCYVNVYTNGYKNKLYVLIDRIIWFRNINFIITGSLY